MKIGITGTRNGGSAYQLKKLENMLEDFGATELHHGDCVGIDAQAHEIARTLGLRVVVHPPLNPTMRAWCKGDVMREPEEYIQRNHNIVDETDYLFAFPDSPEHWRSGTWATIRWARGQNKPFILTMPNGPVEA